MYAYIFLYVDSCKNYTRIAWNRDARSWASCCSAVAGRQEVAQTPMQCCVVCLRSFSRESAWLTASCGQCLEGWEEWLWLQRSATKRRNTLRIRRQPTQAPAGYHQWTLSSAELLLFFFISLSPFASQSDMRSLCWKRSSVGRVRFSVLTKMPPFGSEALLIICCCLSVCSSTYLWVCLSDIMSQLP